jgi:hypothetical protein
MNYFYNQKLTVGKGSHKGRTGYYQFTDGQGFLVLSDRYVEALEWPEILFLVDSSQLVIVLN